VELVVFISHIFNDFILSNFLTIKNNLLDNQKLIWLTTDNNVINEAKNINSDIEFLSLNMTKDYMINYPELYIDKNRIHPDLAQLYVSIFSTYPDYDNYWFIENDVRIIAKDQNNSFKVIFEHFRNLDYDIIADHIKNVMSDDASIRRYWWFCHSLLPKYNIDPHTIWKGFFPVCRLSNKILKSYSESNDIFTKMFFEMSFISFANKYGMSFFSLDSNNLFSIENKLHPFLNCSVSERAQSTNTGSNSWHTHSLNETKHNLLYHDNTIIHSVKSEEENPLRHEQYNVHSQNLKIWACGERFEIPKELDRMIYNKFDISLPYRRYNVNEFNRIFSEFVMMYYIYANNIYSKYVGTAHYRRFPKAEMIDLDNIETNNSIQVFEFFNNRKFSPIEEYEYPDFAFIEHQVNEFDGPKMLVHDMVEYLKSNTHLDTNEIIEYAKHKDFVTFYQREIFVMKWDMFIEMCQFVEDYIHHISNKYSIYSLYDWIEHIKTNVIEHYRKPKERTKLQKCYQWQPEKFNSIYNSNYGYGVSNCWRVYSYMIEILISVYIGTHNNFFIDDSLLKTYKRMSFPNFTII